MLLTQNFFGISVSRMLIENNEILLKNQKIGDALNSYFDSVTDSLDLFSLSTQTDNKNSDALQNILKTFHNHPSLIKIRQLVNNQTKFSFQPVTLQIPDSHCEKKNTQNEHIIAHFEYFFTCHYSKTVWLAENLNEIKITHYFLILGKNFLILRKGWE